MVFGGISVGQSLNTSVQRVPLVKLQSELLGDGGRYW
jgi:hypothetical protein